MLSRKDGEFSSEYPSEYNQLACLSESEQPTPLNTMFESLIHVSSIKSSSSSDVSEFETMDISPI